jgi:F0F1-type ATP synthase assembly protein I
MEITKNKSLANQITYGIFLIILNVIITSILGLMTLDSEANINSRVGGILLSFFIPFFIVYQTKDMNSIERVLKFGFGTIAYFIATIIILGLTHSLATGLIPCLVIWLNVLYYGEKLIKEKGKSIRY